MIFLKDKSMKKLRLLEIKDAILKDHRFRELFPELQDDFAAVLSNPGCGCNIPVYKKVLEYKDRLIKYFPNREVETPQEEVEQLSKNEWTVINCKIDELEKYLKQYHGQGRKQLAVARYEDKVTVIINDLGIIF